MFVHILFVTSVGQNYCVTKVRYCTVVTDVRLSETGIYRNFHMTKVFCWEIGASIFHFEMFSKLFSKYVSEMKIARVRNAFNEKSMSKVLVELCVRNIHIAILCALIWFD